MFAFGIGFGLTVDPGFELNKFAKACDIVEMNASTTVDEQTSPFFEDARSEQRAAQNLIQGLRSFV